MNNGSGRRPVSLLDWLFCHRKRALRTGVHYQHCITHMTPSVSHELMSLLRVAVGLSACMPLLHAGVMSFTETGTLSATDLRERF